MTERWILFLLKPSFGIVKHCYRCNHCHGNHCHGDDYIVYVGSRSLYVLCSVTKRSDSNAVMNFCHCVAVDETVTRPPCPSSYRAHVKPIFQSICAKADGEPCCDWVGADGAGHYVKMVHNGIEYGDMQLICEAYHLMKDILGMSHDEMGAVSPLMGRQQTSAVNQSASCSS